MAYKITKYTNAGREVFIFDSYAGAMSALARMRLEALAASEPHTFQVEELHETTITTKNKTHL